MKLSDFLPSGVYKDGIMTTIPPERTIGGEFQNMVERFKNFLSGGKQEPTPTPTISATTPPPSPIGTLSTSQPQKPTPPPFEFNFEPHIGPDTKREIYAPPEEDLPLYQEYFPKEATSSATVSFNESMYNPEAINQNTDGTWDRGYFQMNDVAVQDLLKFYPNTMKKIGVKNFKDWVDNKWKDKEINFAVAKLYREKFEDRSNIPPWSRWYGWQDQGFKDVGKRGIDYSK